MEFITERIEPGKPQQNGRHERMHRTLKREVCKPPKHDLRAQQQAFDEFMSDYNNARPHQGLQMRTPAELYVVSARQMPLWLPEVHYPPHMILRKVKASGQIKLDGHEIRISDALIGEHLGLRFEDDDKHVTVFYCKQPLGTINLHEPCRKLTPSKGAGGHAPQPPSADNNPA